jgi:hypothetical protein
MLSVMQYAIFKKSESCRNYSEAYKRILSILITKKQYFTKNELLFLVKCEADLDKILNDLKKAGLIKLEGWLVKINDEEKIREVLIE